MSIREVLKFKNEDGDVNPVFVICVLSFIVIVAVMLGFIIKENELANSNMTYIDNLSRYAPSMPDLSRESIYRRLYNVISENKRDDEKTPNRGAKIRENSYTEKEAVNDIYISEFIVDIPAVKQSYSVGLSWSKKQKSVQENYYVGIECVDDSETIYDDFVCENESSTEQMFPGNDMSSNPATYLPHTEYDKDNNPIYQITYYDGWIMVSLQTCGEEKLETQYRAEVDEWLKNTKIDLEEYPIRYRTTCDGSF